MLKKMREGGVLVPGASAGRKGSGCFKLSAEEKERMSVAQRAAAKKLKAQQKSTLGKVNLTGCHMLVNCCIRSALRLPRRPPRRLSRKLQPRKLLRERQHLLDPRDQRASRMRTPKRKKHQVTEGVQIMSQTSL